MPFETFEHTADVGLRITAPDLPALFAEAARGFTSLIVENLDDVRPQREVRIALEAEDLEGLLVDWLAELLFYFETQHLLLAEFDIALEGAEAHFAGGLARRSSRSPTNPVRLRATARGEPVDWNRHELHHEIKAVTYHRLRVERTERGWEAEVIFDI